MERKAGFEPASSGCKPDILPLNYSRNYFGVLKNKPIPKRRKNIIIPKFSTFVFFLDSILTTLIISFLKIISERRDT